MRTFLVLTFLLVGCGGTSNTGGDAGVADAAIAVSDAGAECRALADSWSQVIDALDRSCTAVADCVVPDDCGCGAPSPYNPLGAWAPAVNSAAYQASSAIGLETQYYTGKGCSSIGYGITDCGPATIACSNGTCDVASRGSCIGPPPPDAGH